MESLLEPLNVKQEHVITLSDMKIAHVVCWIAGMAASPFGPAQSRRKHHSALIFLADWGPCILFSSTVLIVYSVYIIREPWSVSSALGLLWPLFDVTGLIWGNVFIRRGHFDSFLSLSGHKHMKLINISFILVFLGTGIWSLFVYYYQSLSSLFSLGSVISAVVYLNSVCIYVVTCFLLGANVDQYSRYISKSKAKLWSEDKKFDAIRQHHLNVYEVLQDGSSYLSRFVVTYLFLLILLLFGSIFTFLFSDVLHVTEGPPYFVGFALIEACLCLVPAGYVNSRCVHARRSSIMAIHSATPDFPVQDQVEDKRHRLDSLVILMDTCPLHFAIFEVDVTGVLILKIVSAILSLLIVMIRFSNSF